ncbi:MAG: tRNA lysidine(34) synthetase TilS [Aequorivita sp.]|nr:tRNA lysidine(34) synthetase TilS [Aequorivita sp.]
MFKQFKYEIENKFSFLIGSRILVACSGGLDSVVLTHLLSKMNLKIALAHCNFSLRGKESDDDEDFVINLAENLGVTVYTETFDTKKYAKEHKISTQMAARDLRYAWFEELLTLHKFQYIVTAHHLDDDLETFFINLSRGTGLSGLSGIPKKNNKVVRPLLNFSREDIFQYAQKNSLNWREDSSNKKADYLRNKLRLAVLPQFKTVNPAVLQNFKTTQSNIRASQLLIDDYIAIVYNRVVTEAENAYKIDIQKLRDFPHTKQLLYELLKDFGFTEWDDVSNLLDAQTGKQVYSQTHRLLKNRDELLLTKMELDNLNREFPVSKKGIETPISLKFEETKYIGETEKNLIYVDSARLNFPLKLRRWQDGDSFHPFGMKGKKKLSKFFKDEKLSQLEKEKTWVLVSDDSIVWIVGHRMDDNFKVTKNTLHILKITYRP